MCEREHVAGLKGNLVSAERTRFKVPQVCDGKVLRRPFMKQMVVGCINTEGTIHGKGWGGRKALSPVR